jgi:hypothetical protein
MATLQFERLHEKNLKELKASIKAYGTVWIHGDGNIYHTEENSNNAQQFVNTQFSAPTYRTKYSTGDILPKTVEELERALQDGKMNEIKKEKTVVAANKLPIVFIDEDDEEETVINEQPKRGRPTKGE